MKTYSFYTYAFDHQEAHESTVVTIEASDEDTAWELFESQYPGYFVDQVLSKQNLHMTESK
jgi:hypothetical protein